MDRRASIYNATAPLIERYAPPRMREVWSDRHRFELWLQIEVLTCEAWADIGRIPAEALPRLRAATFDVEKIEQLEARVGHDVVAFLQVVGDSIGQPEARYLHLGLTSSDIVDTAFALQLREAAEIILEDLGNAVEAARRLALANRRTLMAGRTHGVHAEPITFGFKVAGWVGELERGIARLRSETESIATGKLSGPVGTYSSVDPAVEAKVCKKLRLSVEPASTQVVSRERHAGFMAALAVVAAVMERIALEVRHLQRSEVLEVLEPFGPEQKGSSAMPHKRNPVRAERICGLARLVRGYSTTAIENVALWHERDISHSSAERVIFPDASCVVDFMALELGSVLTGLEVRPQRMAANLAAGGGVVYSQRVLLALVDAGMARDDAYRIVQSAALRALDGDGGFRANLESDGRVRALIGDRLDQLFNPEDVLAHVDLAFDRLGLGVTV